ncbi:hypothetical protein Hypma_001379 [Hypsizygus marmoreus]|uniref:Uncharacterized protein n=1 Tax=Hypsizygus marmoreus TaxID=39966 RepID=A0A369KB98_HYPMA|nr:hypothetical protein Hypma_001379 [Hypsizygus marmoreus]
MQLLFLFVSVRLRVDKMIARRPGHQFGDTGSSIQLKALQGIRPFHRRESRRKDVEKDHLHGNHAFSMPFDTFSTLSRGKKECLPRSEGLLYHLTHMVPLLAENPEKVFDYRPEHHIESRAMDALSPSLCFLPHAFTIPSSHVLSYFFFSHAHMHTLESTVYEPRLEEMLCLRARAPFYVLLQAGFLERGGDITLLQ